MPTKDTLLKRATDFLKDHWLELLIFTLCIVTLLQVWRSYPFVVGQQSRLPQPNEIGDMLGGISGPFINLIAAVLVYRSFKAQIIANRTIHQELEQSEIYRVVEGIEKIIDKVESELKFYQFEGYTVLAGSESIAGYWDWLSKTVKLQNLKTVDEAVRDFRHHFSKQYNFYYWLSYAKSQIEKHRRLSPEDTRYLKTRLAFVFNEYLAANEGNIAELLQNLSHEYTEKKHRSFYKRLMLINIVHGDLLAMSTYFELHEINGRVRSLRHDDVR